MANSQDQDQAAGQAGDRRFEHVLREAFSDVIVPNDLRAKLRERIRMESQILAELPQSDYSQGSRSSGNPIDPSVDSSRRLSNVKRLRIERFRMVAIAAAIGLLAGGFFYFRQPRSSAQLVEHCSFELNELLDVGAEWNDDAARKSYVLKAVKLSRELDFVGGHARSAGAFGEECIVWKFAAKNGQSLFVFEFLNAPAVEGVTGQLKVLQRVSGSWSMAAVRASDRLFVVMTQGDLNNHIQVIPTA